MTLVLDACCGTRMFWFDRSDERATFMDIREKSERLVDVGTPGTKGRKPLILNPDIVADFRDMPFEDETFHHVVFDPPQMITLGESSSYAFKYGRLNKETWRDDIKKGFSECFRVLKTNGTLIFKWSEVEIPLKEVLSLTDYKPLYGHRSGKKARTHWVAFLKS